MVLRHLVLLLWTLLTKVMIKVFNPSFCNVSSVLRFLGVNNLEYCLNDNNSEFHSSDILILPGVGTFEEGMNYLTSINALPSLRQHAYSGGTIVGICLGMQLLLNSSEESPGVQGLSLIPGSCTKLAQENKFVVPHIGWNHVSPNLNNCDLFRSSQYSELSHCLNSDFYFVHSFVASDIDPKHQLAVFDHPTSPQTAAIACENIFGFQFHPEKSGPNGYNLLLNILS